MTALVPYRNSTIVRSFSAALTGLLPRPLGWAATQLFVHTPRRRKPSTTERQVLARARSVDVRSQGRSIRAYVWGEGLSGPPVLLVHGWGGAASQLHAFVDPLLHRGHRVIAFDLPGHGASSGRFTNLVEVAGVIRRLAGWTGRFHSVIAHSLGSAALGVAVADGLEVDRLVVLGAAVEPARYWDHFVGALGLAESAALRARDQLERQVGRRLGEISMLESLAGVSPPLLVVHDEGDRWAPFEDARALAAQLESAEFHATSGLGHSRLLADASVVERVAAFIGCEPTALADASGLDPRTDAGPAGTHGAPAAP